MPLSRKQFLKWAGFGSVGLVAAVVARKFFQPSLQKFKFETVTVDEYGEIVKRSNKQAKFFMEDLGNGVNLEMVSIPGGKFLMGTEDQEIKRMFEKSGWYELLRESPQHEVTVQPFFMGKYPITQAQYQQIMGNNPSYFKDDDRPVERVSWDDAVEFCQRLSKQTEKEYRLPTEAEWEYACRARTTTAYYFGDTITEKLVNYYGTVGETTAVGKYPPNTFGLYDMHGNVREWCQDDWHDNYQGAPNDGRAWVTDKSNQKVVRGGSSAIILDLSRSAYRSSYARRHRLFDVGFRVVCADPRT